MIHRFSSPLRRLSWLLILSVLCSGIAMSAYACPKIAEPVKAMEMAMDGMPCAEMDVEKPAQCAEFQSGGQLALEHLAAPPALTPVLVTTVHPAPALYQSAVMDAEWSDTPPTSGIDPPYLRTLRLRI
ncbi:hypothetical protein [Noviherbaspirillum galbum]|uniref:DUF1190 domain-containing protein n=1 Tax=Noviherbaspirillum galbum TaxID=2709383 RepID=A0A6B3SS51_9BURK|nr:hypothetical protein [Noviherbaspirillum galbum]NEX63338.1 hypothetical protein [Noviherbaspirillum galbum]